MSFNSYVPIGLYKIIPPSPPSIQIYRIFTALPIQSFLCLHQLQNGIFRYQGQYLMDTHELDEKLGYCGADLILYANLIISFCIQ